ncbi:MAG: hypothetical protein E8A46_08810 [Bradyrhizobium sp.]|uniref:hypothetical protein n=1 Tax=Bradyrhizobium sp. TaxID=376 RepID=UPI001202242C|nr:hypothetical protein [Bradyrhizobium sp.]THD54310.1 MAG: hypothetical protein E8A46_08810 [Bradyrhizobium sp.]
MARDSDKRAGNFETENTGGLLSGFLAEEDEFDRRSLWRLGSWAVASVGAVIIAMLANQTSIGTRREQIASADLARQQIQSVAKESQSEARRVASAIETLNGDRDRLYARVSVLEQGLDSVTGAIARQSSAVTPPQAAAAPAASASSAAASPAAAPAPAPVAAVSAEAPTMAQKQPAAPVVSPLAAMPPAPTEKPPTVAAAVDPAPAAASSGAQGGAAKAPAETPATPLMASKSIMAPPDPAAGKLIESSLPPKTVTAAPMPEIVAATPPTEEAEPDNAAPTPQLAVQHTEFGVDVGGANSLPGLRALWRGLLKSRSNAALTALRPIIVIKEGNNGLGMQLRLVAGPIKDAAAAAKICAAMTENDRTCTTTVFEGQRLAMNADQPAADAKPHAAEVQPAAAAKPAVHKHYTFKRAAREEPAAKPEPSTLSRLFGTR